MKFNYVKFEVFIPEDYVDKLREELNSIGVLNIGGNYDNCMAVSKVIGSWRPLAGANPYNGTIGELCRAEECKVEFCTKKQLIMQTLEKIKQVHPYEEPVINVIPIINGLDIETILED